MRRGRAGIRSWRVGVLIQTEPGRRNRRTIDSVLLFWAAIVIGLSAAVAASAPGHDRSVQQALTTVLGWAGPLWRAAFFALIASAALIVVDIVLERRWDVARDVLAALAAVAVATVVLGGTVKSDRIPLRWHPLARWGYPEVRLAAATAVVVAAGPELVRSVRRVAGWLIPVAALGAVVIGATLPSGALAGVALGLAAGSLARILFGSAAGVPPTEQVRAALLSLGVAVESLRPALEQHVGAAEYVGRGANGDPLRVRVLGRDAQDTQRLAREWRLLSYNDPPRSAPAGRLAQVEHEALATLMAAEAGVRVPPVVTAALGPDGDALIVTRQPDLAPLETSSADLVVDEGPMLVNFAAATLGAPQSALDMDVAELLVACTVLVGPDRALGGAVDAGWGASIARILPYLQRAALTPHLRDLARSHEIGLDELRKQAAAATGQELPALVPLRRIRPRDVVVTAMVAVAGYLLI